MSSCPTRSGLQCRLISSQMSRNVPVLPLFSLAFLADSLLSSSRRSLHISPRREILLPSSWKHLSSVLAACLPLLPNLCNLSIHPALLDNLLLNNFLLSSIPYLRFNLPLTRTLFPLELLDGSLLPRSESQPSLQISARFASWITSKADAIWADRLLHFFHELGI